MTWVAILNIPLYSLAITECSIVNTQNLNCSVEYLHCVAVLFYILIFSALFHIVTLHLAIFVQSYSAGILFVNLYRLSVNLYSLALQHNMLICAIAASFVEPCSFMCLLCGNLYRFLVYKYAELLVHNFTVNTRSIHGVNTNKCESSYISRYFDFRSSLLKQKMKLNIL